MSNVLPDYLHAAAAVLDGARLAASRASHIGGAADEAVDDLMTTVERAARRRVAAQLDVTGDGARVVLAAIVAAHTIHARLVFDGDDDTAAAVEAVLPALWQADLTARLDAARQLAATTPGTTGTPGLSELGTLLRRRAGGELVPASGHLVRAVLHAGGQGLAEAWFASLGTYVLASYRLLRPTVTNMVRAGRSPSYVAARSGLSRSTVYAWTGTGSAAKTIPDTDQHSDPRITS